MRRLLPALLLPFLLSACGDKSDDSTIDLGKAMDNAPKCADVWVAGKTLDEKYDGCMDGSTLQAPAYFECANSPKLYQFGDDFWAYLGKEIHDEPGGAADAAAYKAAYSSCMG